MSALYKLVNGFIRFQAQPLVAVEEVISRAKPKQ
jgi:hypothetical protein